MQADQLKIEMKILRSWKLRLALLAAILSPAVTATGAYYNLKSEMKSTVEVAKDQVDAKYARKETIEDLKENVRDMRQDIKDIKDLLIQRSR